MIIGGWGYKIKGKSAYKPTEVIDPLSKAPECSSNKIPGVKEYPPLVTNGKYICTSGPCSELVQGSDGKWGWNETEDLNVPPGFNIWRGSGSVDVNGHWWITNGWKGKPNKKTILLQKNKRQFEDGPDLPEIMYDHCMALTGEGQLLIAGSSYGGSCKDSYFVDVSLVPFKFGPKRTLKHCRSGAACGVLSSYKGQKNVPIVAGGDVGGEKRTTEIWDAAKEEWVMGPNLTRSFSDGGYLTKNGGFTLLGGRFYSKKYKNIMGYNENTEEFDILPGELQGAVGNAERAGFTAVALEDKNLLCNSTCC